MLQGVAAHPNPLEVFTVAPGGVDVTEKSVFVPRTIVAHPLNSTAAATKQTPKA